MYSLVSLIDKLALANVPISIIQPLKVISITFPITVSFGLGIYLPDKGINFINLPLTVTKPNLEAITSSFSLKAPSPGRKSIPEANTSPGTTISFSLINKFPILTFHFIHLLNLLFQHLHVLFCLIHHKNHQSTQQVL